MDWSKENKPRLTSRRERNHLFKYRLHRTRTSCIGSQLSSRPYRSNGDEVFLVPRVIFNNGSRETGFGQENSHILHCHFRFKLIFQSRVVLGCCETCAETSLKSSLAIIRVVWRDVPAVDEVEFRRNFRLSRAAGHFPPLQRASLGREGLEYN